MDLFDSCPDMNHLTLVSLRKKNVDAVADLTWLHKFNFEHTSTSRFLTRFLVFRAFSVFHGEINYAGFVC